MFFASGIILTDGAEMYFHFLKFQPNIFSQYLQAHKRIRTLRNIGFLLKKGGLEGVHHAVFIEKGKRLL